MEVLVKDRIMPTLYNSASARDKSEPVNLDGGLGNTLLGEKVGNLQTLITLELDDLASLFILNESTVASKFLSRAKKSAMCPDRLASPSAYTFLKAFKSFLASYSEGKEHVSHLSNVKQRPGDTHPWANPARWSRSCDRSAVVYGYGYSSAAIQRLGCCRAGHPRLRRGLQARLQRHRVNEAQYEDR